MSARQRIETLTEGGAKELASKIRAYWAKHGKLQHLQVTVVPIAYKQQGKLVYDSRFAVRSNMVLGSPPLQTRDVYDRFQTFKDPPPPRRPKPKPDPVEQAADEYLETQSNGEGAKAAFGSIQGPPWTGEALAEEDPMVG